MNIEKLGITKAPWGYKLEQQNISGSADEGMNIFFETVIDGNGFNICRLQSKSTAQLIATAPEMLEALMDEWNFIESYLASNASRNDGYWYNEFLNRQNIIKSKVEKATGKTWEELKQLDS